MSRGRPPMPEGSVCARCSRVLVRATVWNAAGSAERNAWRAQDRAKAARTNMCTTCHQYLRTHEDLDRYAKVSQGADVLARCVRCGPIELGESA